MKKVIFAALTLVTAASAAAAQAATQQSPQPQVERTATPMKGGGCMSNSFRGANTVYACEHLGNVTLKQIYEKGWKVVSLLQDAEFKTTVHLVIEEQRQ